MPEGVNQSTSKTKVLDDLVAVNSLFTAAVFVGISMSSLTHTSLETRPNCKTNPSTAKDLVAYEVLSFACFFLSSVVAKSLRMLLEVTNIENLHKRVKISLFCISAAASIGGFVFLALSVNSVFLIKMGKLSCLGHLALTGLCVFYACVGLALLFYVGTLVSGAIHFGCFSNVGTS